MNRKGQASLCFLVVAATFGVSQVQTAEFIFGGEARRVCKAYKRVCADGKVCALQTIDWPQSMKFPVCVYKQHKLVKSKVCRKAPQPGRCAAKFTRWYYNIHMQACSWFTYSGCGGNKNNFRTLEECTTTCTSHNDIIKDPDRGPNDAFRENTSIESVRRVYLGETTRDVRRIPVPAHAPDVIDLTDDVTATLSLDGDPADEGEEKDKLVFVDKKENKNAVVVVDDDDDDGVDDNDDHVDKGYNWEDEKKDDEEKEEDDKIAANLAKKLKKQEMRRMRKLERERRRRGKLLRKRERELRRKEKRRERLAKNKRKEGENGAGNDVGVIVISGIPGKKTENGFHDDDVSNNVLPTSTTSRRRERKYLELIRRQNLERENRRRRNPKGDRGRDRFVENRLINYTDARRDRNETRKDKDVRQLTQLELGPYYQTGSSPLPIRRDLSMASSDNVIAESSPLGRERYTKWLIDDRFGLRRSGGSTGRRRSRRWKRGRNNGRKRIGRRRKGRRRRRRKRINKMNDARLQKGSSGNGSSSVRKTSLLKTQHDGSHDIRKDNRADEKVTASEKYYSDNNKDDNRQRLNDQSVTNNQRTLHTHDTVMGGTVDGSKLTFFNVLDGDF